MGTRVQLWNLASFRCGAMGTGAGWDELGFFEEFRELHGEIYLVGLVMRKKCWWFTD